VAAFFAGSCGGGGRTASVEVIDGLVLADVTIDERVHERVLVDTGAPITVLTATLDTPETVPVGNGMVARLDLAGVEFDQVPIVGVAQSGSRSPMGLLGGIVGCTVICQHAITFDYRDAQLTIGAAPRLMGVEPAVTIPFALAGGLNLIPPSRVIIHGDVEGKDHTFILDTGAEIVLLRSSVFDALVADGRFTRRMVFFSGLTMGGSVSTLSRLRRVTVNGLEVRGVVGAGDPSVDVGLDRLGVETGETIDGLLGASFLREFNLTVDYPSKALELARYETRDHILDLFVRVGLDLARTADGKRVTVATVIANTDAESQGVRIGDIVTAIDGVPVDAGDPVASLRQLAGSDGATRTIDFGCDGCRGYHGQRTLKVEDLLPLR
jgi:aspartyl protease